MFFGLLRIFDRFSWKGELYQKISEDKAQPLSYSGEVKKFNSDEPISYPYLASY